MSEEASSSLEWSAFYDDDGQIYYYNTVTGESSWEAPDQEFNPPPEPSQQEAAATGGGEEEGGGGEAGESSESSAWVAYHDDEGRTYYFNSETEETTWDKPAGFVEASSEVTKTTDAVDGESNEGGSFERGTSLEDEDGNRSVGDESPIRSRSPLSSTNYGQMDVDSKSPEVDLYEDNQEEHEVVEEEEEPIDPAVQRLDIAMTALKQTDAIMEPGVLAHVTEVVTSEGGKPLTAIEALSDSYFGETAACGLMSRWLVDLKSQSMSTDSTTERTKTPSSLFETAADEIRNMVQDVINRLATERFTKTGGDKILNLSKSEAAFLKEMMISSRWRKLLIDLSATNKDSALLMYCLEQISKRGHHREIARRINQSDHFTVFHAMLASEVQVIGKIAVTSCKGADTSIPLEDLVDDLKRTCASTAYTYIYAIEVLRQLVATAKQKASTDSEYQSPLFVRAIRKWERLAEELQSAIVDPTASAAGSTPLFRKRRLDVAMTISDLHQRQRQRLVPTDDVEIEANDDASDHGRAQAETAVLEFLRRFSLEMPVDDRMLDKMLQARQSDDSSNFVGKLLIQGSLTVKALLGYLYKPGSQRASSVTVKTKCARLVSLAVQAAQDDALVEARKIDASLTIEHDEEVLTADILESCRLCEILENMVSFIVTTPSGSGDHQSQSHGQKLCALALKSPSIAQGVAIWAREVVKGSEYVASASYPTLSPSILSLTRIMFLKHPFVRDDAMEVAMCFLQHSNSDISYQTMNEIKEQSLRLLLFLCASGEAPVVIGRMRRLLTSSTHFDASLVRYFVSGLLQIAVPPYSVPFVRLMCNLLMAPGTSEAVRTRYFDDGSQKQLTGVVRYMRDLETNGTQGKLSPEDVDLIRSVVAIYAK